MRGWAWILLALAGLALLPRWGSPFAVSLALSCLLYAGLATSWSMFSGPSGYLSLAGTAFFGLGAYCSAWGLGALPWPVLIAAGGLLAMAAALLIGLTVLHLRGAYFAVITFGLGELAMHAVTYFERSHFGTVGRVMTDAPGSSTVYFTVLILAAAAAATYRLVERSRLGLALRGIGADEERAATLGVNPRNAKLAAFTLSAWFPGALGAAMAVRWTYIDPRTVFSPFIVFQTVLIAMVGGPSRLSGPIVGAAIFSLLAEFLRLELPYVYMVLLGTLLVVSVLYLPDGLAALSWRRLLASARERVAGALHG
jgi:branched-chain amino acid transport system permease protein